MDIEKLTKETILKNMTPEQQKTVLESVMASVQESKKVRTQKIAENVDLVMQALKRIEAQMLQRVEKASSTVETVAKNVKDGKDGRDGKDGKDGKDGVQGPKGADGRDGKNGKDGKDGRDGVDGVSVANAFLDFDNSLVIELTNGKQINVGGLLSDDIANKVKVIANGGGTSQYVLDAIAALQAEIDAISPTLVITDTFVVGSQAEMLALSTAEQGDVAVRTDLNKTFILKQAPYSTLANWQELLTPTDAVQSVNGKTGTVVLTTTDVAEGTNQYFTTSRARSSVSAGTGISYDSATGVVTNSAPDQTVSLTAGTGISTSGTYPNFTITNSSPDQTVSITGSGTTTVTGTYPNFTVSSADAYVGTVASVAALTLGTTGTDVSSTVATGTTTPVITLNIPTASATNRGALSSTDWSTFNGKQAALVSGTNIKTVSGTSLLGSGDVGTIGIAYGGTNATSFTAPSGNVKGLVFYDGTKLTNDTTVTDVGYDTSTHTLTANNFSASGSATAGSFKTTNFTIIESGGSLLIKYGATTIASISSTGVITSAVNIISNGTP